MADSIRSVGAGKTPTVHALSVDVEDYFQVWALSSVINRSDWDDISLRVRETAKRTLDLLDATGSKATFFTLGWVAERCPEVIRDIHNAGHELASHGYDHTKVFDQTADEFRDDISKTKKILEDIISAPVNGFRAAGFSLSSETPWAHEILAETGHFYSSSVHPIAHDHYHAPDLPRFAYQPLSASNFLEIPVSTVTMFGRRFSCAGGGWFRALPYAVSSYLINRMISTDGHPAVFYFHPWEIDPDQPKVSGLNQKSKFRHYLNLDIMEAKLDRLFRQFSWNRMDQVFSTDSVEKAA